MAYVEATTHTNTGALVWDTEGYYVFGSDSWKDISITAKMIYQDGTMGLIPRFDSELTYVSFTIETITSTGVVDGVTTPSVTSTTASLFAQISANKIYLAEKKLDVNLVIGQEYIIKIDIKRTNYKVYLDGVLLFNIEYNGLNNGSGALYGTIGTKATLIEAQALLPDGWISNVDTISGALVDIQRLANDDKYIFIKNPGTTELHIEQIINVVAGWHTVSAKTIGAVKARVVEQDGVAPQTTPYTFPINIDWAEDKFPLEVSSDCTQIKLTFYTNTAGEGLINDIQVEPLKYKTSYIHNNSLTASATRGSSYVTYPAKDNISNASGTISLWIKPLITYNATLGQSPTFVEYGNADGKIRLYYDGTNMQFVYGSNSLTMAQTLVKDTWYHVVASWSNYKVQLAVNGIATEKTGIYTFTGSSDTILIGHSGDGTVFNGVLDELIIYLKVIDQDYIKEIYEAIDPIATTDDMLLRATFNYAIGSFDRSVIEMSPAPLYGSPIIARKQDGTIMQKVSFFNNQTGKFKTYNTEYVTYDGKSNYLRVGYKDIDTQTFRIAVRDALGQIIGEPYQVVDNKVSITLTDVEKKALRGKSLSITYQPDNPYTVDFNIDQPDSFRVTLGKHDGQPISIDYEGNRFSQEKLTTMVELNPLLNPNHKGFMYIVKEPNEISTFRAKASPTDLLADGVSESVVTIEPLDTSGNFVSFAQLEVSAKYGSITTSYDPGTVRMRETAGRYIYRYHAPFMTYTEKKTMELIDSINVVDKVKGLGVQIPIMLSLSDNYYTIDMTKPTEVQAWEMIGGYLCDKITEHMGKLVSELPVGLQSILDFNGDGIINLDEIIWLNEHKFTQDLYNKYISILSWYKANG